MKKTDTFFIISNYNTDPEKYLEYCEDYHIYDQSPDIKIREQLKAKYTKISFVENSGHNITNYFRYFIDHYDHLPAHMMLVKGNMIGGIFPRSFLTVSIIINTTRSYMTIEGMLTSAGWRTNYTMARSWSLIIPGMR